MSYRFRKKDYATLAEASADIGVTPWSLTRALNEGREDTVGLKPRGPKAVWVDGKRYASAIQASKEEGINYNTLLSTLNGKGRCHGKQVCYDK